MKCALALFTLFMVAALAYSFPAEDIQQQLANDLMEQAGEATEQHLDRQKRASCDLFTFEIKGFKANHAVCAAHCIALGNRGGECRGTVCHCRK